MHIQQESPRIHNPLATLEEDYEQAVLHLAWEEREGTDERRLLFGMVELLPIEIPPPLDDGEQATPLEGGPSVRIHLRRVVVSAARALAWYLDCRRGIGVFPDKDGELSGAAQAGTKFKLADLGEEPPWPSLVCISGESPTVPFCPNWHESPRVHHLIPLSEQGPSRMWLKEQMREHATRWLSDRLHFRFEEYPEYWGSIHLVAPNPVFRAVHERLLKGTPPNESIVMRFEMRAGKRVDGLSLIYRDRKPWGPLEVREVRVESPVLRFDFERETEILALEVLDERRGVLCTPAYGHIFVRGFSIESNIGTEKVRIKGKSQEDSYEVQRVGAHPKPLQVDAVKTASAGSRMGQAHMARKTREEANTHDQQWFSEGRHEAAQALRNRIVEAEEMVFFIDPHFGREELFAFAPAVSRENVPVFILCAAGPLSTTKTLLKALEQLRGQDPKASIEIRVMLGDPPPIQDVFLQVDKQLWILGSSFAQFGERGSLLAKVADPKPVIEHIRKTWEDAVELSRWVEAMQKHEMDRHEEGV